MPGTTAALVAGVQALPPEVTSWSATGIGRTHLPIMAAALSLGGHLRVGMEDNLVFARRQPVRDNAQLVERAADLTRTMQRPPLTTEEARSLLRVKERRRPPPRRTKDEVTCMTTQPQDGGRRPIDRVLSPGYADDATGLTVEELHERRHEAEQEEVDLSYARRLLQGRLDLLRSEQAPPPRAPGRATRSLRASAATRRSSATWSPP